MGGGGGGAAAAGSGDDELGGPVDGSGLDVTLMKKKGPKTEKVDGLERNLGKAQVRLG